MAGLRRGCISGVLHDGDYTRPTQTTHGFATYIGLPNICVLADKYARFFERFVCLDYYCFLNLLGSVDVFKSRWVSLFRKAVPLFQVTVADF